MVHNGIEYGDMQLICEAYQLLKDGLGLTPRRAAEIFAEWNKGELDSYLIEITANIFAKKDDDGSRWSTRSSTPPARKAPASGPCISALDLGMPVTLIAEAVFARCLSRSRTSASPPRPRS
jgi:6-phosphogluconate dehydrogenase